MSSGAITSSTWTAIELAGEGELHLRFEALKADLEAEGLFAPARKRALPVCPVRRRSGYLALRRGSSRYRAEHCDSAARWYA